MTVIEGAFETLNLNKANFDAIYRQPDPREYFRVLWGLDYVIPELAKKIFRSLIDSCSELHARRVRVLDLGCSYGINSALVRFPLDMQRLARRYSNPATHSVPTNRLREWDKHYFRSWPELVNADFIGLDTADSALSYACEVGLLQGGVAADLENHEPNEAEAACLANIDIMVSTGCVGYISEKTFDRILSLQKAREVPWVASFVLRMFPYDRIADELERFGLITEKLEGVTFVQRRFHSQDEFESTMGALRTLGIDPLGKEADGLYHAELFLSRPKSEVRRMPLGELVSITSGGSRTYGRRYQRVTPRGVKLMP